jgi:hypothetical protein
MHAGEIGSAGASMIAGTIALRAAAVVRKPAEQQDVVAVRDERLQHTGKPFG